MLGPVSSQIAPSLAPFGGERSQSLATKGFRRLPAQRLFDHRMAAGDDGKGVAVIHHRAAIALFAGKRGKAGRDINDRQCARGCLDRLGMRDNDPRCQLVEGLEFQRQYPVGRVSDLAFKFRKLRRRETHGVGHGLAMDEAGAALVRIVIAPALPAVTSMK